MRVTRHLNLLAIGITLLCYWNVARHDFVVYDDEMFVRHAPYANPPTLDNILRTWREPYAALYVPVTYSAWGGLAALTSAPGRGSFEHDPRVFHIANLVVHLLSVAAAFSLLRMLTRNEWAAFAGALLFALHPLQVAPVAWVSGFKDVLGGCLLLVALHQYVRYARAPAETRRRWVHYGLASFAFVLAMLSKPGTVVAPLLAGIIACTLLRRPVRRVAAELLPWLPLAVVVFLVTNASQPVTKIDFITPFWQRPLIAGDALAFYLYKLSWPMSLGPDYGRMPGWVLSHGWVYATALLPAVLAGVLVWKRRRPWLLASCGVFAAGLLPTLGLVPFTFQNISTVADRYVYFAMLGPAIALAGLVKTGRKRWGLPVCVVLLGLLGVRSVFQVRHWRDTRALFEHALAVNPKSALSHVNLGVFAQRERRVADAIAHCKAAVRLNPKEPSAHYNLGAMMHQAGKLDLAAVCYADALEADPNYAAPHYALGIILQERGELDKAFDHFTKTLEHTRRWTHYIYARLGSVCEKQGKLDEAADYYSKVLEVEPSYTKARTGLNRVLARKKKGAPPQ